MKKLLVILFSFFFLQSIAGNKTDSVKSAPLLISTSWLYSCPANPSIQYPWYKQQGTCQTSFDYMGKYAIAVLLDSAQSFLRGMGSMLKPPSGCPANPAVQYPWANNCTTNISNPGEYATWVLMDTLFNVIKRNGTSNISGTLTSPYLTYGTAAHTIASATGFSFVAGAPNKIEMNGTLIRGFSGTVNFLQMGSSTNDSNVTLASDGSIQFPRLVMNGSKIVKTTQLGTSTNYVWIDAVNQYGGFFTDSVVFQTPGFLYTFRPSISGASVAFDPNLITVSRFDSLPDRSGRFVLANDKSITNNQSLKWNGTQYVPYTPTSGTLTGSGVANQVSYWNGSTSLTGNQNFLWDPTNKVLEVGSPSFQVGAKGIFADSVNNFAEVLMRNKQNGTLSSADFVVQNNGDSTNYADFGINSAGNTDATYTAFKGGDAYIYANKKGFNIAAATADSVKIEVGGTLIANEIFVATKAQVYTNRHFTPDTMQLANLPNSATYLGQISFSRTATDTSLQIAKRTGTHVNETVDTINLGAFKAYTTSFTGFSSNPTGVTSVYNLVGKQCTVVISMTNGTSNTTAFTITLPFPAKRTMSFIARLTGFNNGLFANAEANTTAGSTSCGLSTGGGLTSWTNSGAKGVDGTIIYEIQ